MESKSDKVCCGVRDHLLLASLELSALSFEVQYLEADRTKYAGLSRQCETTLEFVRMGLDCIDKTSLEGTTLANHCSRFRCRD